MKTWIQGFFALLLALAVLPSNGMANEISVRNQNIDNECLDISCLLNASRVLDDKVYVAPGIVYVSPNQIYLNVAGQLLPIQHLSSDKNGVFVSLEEVLTGASRKTWTCPNKDCGYVNYDGINDCAICGTNRYTK